MTELFPGPVLASLRDAASRPAIEIGPRTVSRGELLGMVRRLVGGLREAGLSPRTGAGLVLSLSPEAYAAHLAAHALGWELARPDDVARLTYTSGSTGQPKACAHTYRAISLAYQPDRWAPVLKRLLTHFQRCLIHESLAGPVMFTYLGRCLVTGGTVVLPDRLALPEAIERVLPSAIFRS